MKPPPPMPMPPARASILYALTYARWSHALLPVPDSAGHNRHFRIAPLAVRMSKKGAHFSQIYRFVDFPCKFLRAGRQNYSCHLVQACTQLSKFVSNSKDVHKIFCLRIALPDTT